MNLLLIFEKKWVLKINFRNFRNTKSYKNPKIITIYKFHK